MQHLVVAPLTVVAEVVQVVEVEVVVPAVAPSHCHRTGLLEASRLHGTQLDFDVALTPSGPCHTPSRRACNVPLANQRNLRKVSTPATLRILVR